MEFWESIGQGLSTFCSTIWNGLKAVWKFIKKVVSTLFSWTVSVVGWLSELAEDLMALVVIGVVVFFIWIFGSDDRLEGEDTNEETLGKQIRGKLNEPHKKIIIKGVFNKNTNTIEKKTQIEATESISDDVIKETGGSRFAELTPEE